MAVGALQEGAPKPTSHAPRLVMHVDDKDTQGYRHLFPGNSAMHICAAISEKSHETLYKFVGREYYHHKLVVTGCRSPVRGDRGPCMWAMALGLGTKLAQGGLASTNLQFLLELRTVSEK